MDEHVVYLALGSNMGNRAANLKEAIASLAPQMEVKARSAVYETDPWGFKEQEKFLNQVVRVETYLKPEQLIKHLKRLEVALGRKESFPNGPRLIDIDILFYDDLVLYSPALTIPHPHLHERAFVLVPLMDIASDLVHPVKKKSIRELALFADVSGVRKLEG
ncbi:MAG: 2-amino-4-hydroxy-6-hydroxymethyldihydropteridine diphosphokinase [Anaerolineae bacterium]|nr:2-amino-4-hydroxy-6-hydroxymethyldihydropteridine diphosphokinase [Anaerolineae bacterium]MBL8107142.1 2-amino-4-hydroxy-6-hydroxymethyldihydropteridine diphosphokinase [Anaerolineales bacterium]MCC7188663.1 2-amino-4-hydroxy-6-hydroxymethyldihydropteridine diphosphokinase [Anaerolineales bacterium]